MLPFLLMPVPRWLLCQMAVRPWTRVVWLLPLVVSVGLTALGGYLWARTARQRTRTL